MAMPARIFFRSLPSIPYLPYETDGTGVPPRSQAGELTQQVAIPYIDVNENITTGFVREFLFQGRWYSLPGGCSGLCHVGAVPFGTCAGGRYWTYCVYSLGGPYSGYSTA
jgi:hypothetical protein